MTTVKLEGIGSVHAAFLELERDFGSKAVTSKVLTPAVRESMKPVLAMAQRLAPVDTGGLKKSLRIEARKPTRRDRRSKYITETDTVMASVTTAPGKWLTKHGIKSDARAIAQEFGTANMAKQPFLLPAIRANAQNTVTILGAILARRMAEYRIKKTK